MPKNLPEGNWCDKYGDCRDKQSDLPDKFDSLLSGNEKDIAQWTRDEIQEIKWCQYAGKLPRLPPRLTEYASAKFGGEGKDYERGGRAKYHKRLECAFERCCAVTERLEFIDRLPLEDL